MFLAITVRFEYSQMNLPSFIVMPQFVDTKTISFVTPPCPVPLTRNNPKITIPIVVSER